MNEVFRAAVYLYKNIPGIISTFYSLFQVFFSSGFDDPPEKNKGTHQQTHWFYLALV
jgi:hypothetical protein